jgi:hypothetical protein
MMVGDCKPKIGIPHYRHSYFLDSCRCLGERAGPSRSGHPCHHHHYRSAHGNGGGYCSRFDCNFGKVIDFPLVQCFHSFFNCYGLPINY